MALRTIRVDGDDVLRKVCKPVKQMKPRTEELIDDMFETMYAANGVGLAAPQVGVLKRIVVIDVMDGNPLVLINPEIVEEDGEQVGPEGCLSLPGLEGEVTRPEHVICKALDRNMDEITVEGTGLLARAICHELDHLDGILYKDKVNDGLHRVQPADPDDFDDEYEDEDEESTEE
ncbi:MAG: peptide deformylase [Eubacterium sp.]|jgi:peptide deformylase|nr:peptide deformylase [Eubacterium sp.]